MAEQNGNRVVRLKPTPLTPHNFAPFGQVVGPSPDGAEFGPHDAQLHLSAGIPRFYIMRLEDRRLCFSNITHHASVSQCLGSVGGLPWYIGVAKASIVKHVLQDDSDPSQQGVPRAIRSRAGHHYIRPSPDEVKVFRIEGPLFLKFHVGTWHAGPLFKEPTMEFYNLELSNTNACLDVLERLITQQWNPTLSKLYCSNSNTVSRLHWSKLKQQTHTHTHVRASTLFPLNTNIVGKTQREVKIHRKSC